MKKLLFFFSVFFGLFIVQSNAQQQLVLVAKKDKKQDTLIADRILRIETEEQIFAGSVTQLNETSLTIQTSYKRGKIKVDTSITVALDSIHEIAYCDVKNAKKCAKRRNVYWADPWIKASTAVIFAGALTGSYFDDSPNSKITWIGGGALCAIGYYVWMNYMTGPKYYNLDTKWNLKKQ